MRAVIVGAFPELARPALALNVSWDSAAVDVDDRLIFKFPRHEAAEKRLVTEASLLAVIRPAVTMPVPDLTLHPGPPLFSRHAKLKGEQLLAAAAIVRQGATRISMKDHFLCSALRRTIFLRHMTPAADHQAIYLRSSRTSMFPPSGL